MPDYSVIGWLAAWIGTILLTASVLLPGCRRKKKIETVKESGKDESWYDRPYVDCRDELAKAVDAAWDQYYAEQLKNHKPGDPPLIVNGMEEGTWKYFKREEILADRERKKQDEKNRRQLEKERKERIDEIKAGKTRDSDSDENTEGLAQGDFEEVAVLIEPPETEKAANNLQSDVEKQIEKKEETRDGRKTGTVLGSGPLGLTAQSGTKSSHPKASGSKKKKEDSRMKRQLLYMENKRKEAARASRTYDEKRGGLGAKSGRESGAGRGGESGTVSRKGAILGSGPIGGNCGGVGLALARAPAKKE